MLVVVVAAGCFSTARSNRDLQAGQAQLELRGPFVLGSGGDFGLGGRVGITGGWDALAEIAAGHQQDGWAYGGTIGTRFDSRSLAKGAGFIAELDVHLHRTGDALLHWATRAALLLAGRGVDVVPIIGVRAGWWTGYQITRTDAQPSIDAESGATLITASLAFGVEWLRPIMSASLFLDLGLAWSPLAREAAPAEETPTPSTEAALVIVPTIDVAFPFDL